MAKYFNLVEREGRLVRVYESGLEMDDETGKIIKPAAGTLITRQNSTELHRRRREKTAALMRQRITETHNSTMPSPARTSAEAFAESAAMLYEQVVLNSEAYPRDRLEAWEKIGKYSGLLPADAKEKAEDIRVAIQNNITPGISLSPKANEILLEVLEGAYKAQKAMARGESPEEVAKKIVDGKLITP